MQHTASQNGQNRQHAVKGSAVTACQNGYIARGGTMAPAADWAINRFCALCLDHRAQAFDLGFVCRAHFRPDLACAQACQDAVFCLQHCRTGGRGGQAGDGDITRLCHSLGACGSLGPLFYKGCDQRVV